MKRSTYLLLLTVAAALAWPAATPAQGETQLKRVRQTPETRPLPDLRTDRGKEALIRRSYEAVTRYSHASGHRPSFELSGFRTFQRIDFSRLRWFDLVTLPGGRVLQVSRHTVRGADGRPARRFYVPGWAAAPQEYARSPEGRRFAHATIDRVLIAAAGSQPELLGVTSITAYRVRATLDGESRAYRAAFLWTEHGDTLTYIAYDQVTGRVDDALAEDLPSGPDERRLDALVGGLESFSAASGETCVAETVLDTSSGLNAAGFEGHTSGQHELMGGVSFSCRCGADCGQTCTSNVYASCKESGTTDTCHKISNASQASEDGQVFSATTASSTARCAAGAACEWQACRLCFCSPSVSVSIKAFSFSIASSSGTATLEKSKTLQCPPCTVVPCNQNGVCDASSGETVNNCAADCGCDFDGLCNAARGENQLNCTDCTMLEDPNGGGDGTSGGGSGGGAGGDPAGACETGCDCDGDGWVTVLECEFDCGGIADLHAGICWI